jgi:O-antigen/teichoic acid export membrane protein
MTDPTYSAAEGAATRYAPESMKRGLARAGVIYGGTSLLSGVSNVALVALYTRTIERSAYGVVDFIATLQLVIQVMVGLELTQGIARFYGDSDDRAEGRAYASTGLWALALAYGVFCALLFVAADAIESMLLGTTAPGIVRPALLSIYLGIMFYVLRSQLRWELRPSAYALSSLVSVLVTLVLSAYLLVIATSGLVGVFVGLSGGYIAGLAVCLYALRGTYIAGFDVPKLRQMLTFSLPLTISSLALLAASYGDRIIVRGLLGFDDLGIYAVGAKIASVIALATAGFQLGAAPLIYRHFRREDAPAELAQVLRLFLVAASLGVLGLASVSIQLVSLFAGPTYADAARLVPLLSLGILLASGYIFLPGLAIRRMTSRFAAISIATALVSLTAMAVLASGYGTTGAAIGVLCGAGTGFGLHAFYSQRVYALPMDWSRVASTIAIVLAATVACASLAQPGAASFFARVAVSGLAGVAVISVLLSSEDRGFVVRLLGTPLHRRTPLGP